MPLRAGAYFFHPKMNAKFRNIPITPIFACKIRAGSAEMRHFFEPRPAHFPSLRFLFCPLEVDRKLAG